LIEGACQDPLGRALRGLAAAGTPPDEGIDTVEGTLEERSEGSAIRTRGLPRELQVGSVLHAPLPLGALRAARRASAASRRSEAGH